MINREKLNIAIDAMEAFAEFADVTITINSDFTLKIGVYPKLWWKQSARFTDEDRHRVLSAFVPLVGKLTKDVDGTDISYSGEVDGVRVNINRADICKIVGYKRVTKKVPRTVIKEVVQEREIETGEFEEQEELRPITDCEIRMGKASESDIEVPVS